MSHSRIALGDVTERTTPVVSFTIQDDSGTGFTPDTLTLTLYVAARNTAVQHRQTGDIINGRDKQDALNANGVAVDGLGNVVWTLTSDDTVMIESALATEAHIALFEWTWNAGAKQDRKEFEMVIENLARVP